MTCVPRGFQAVRAAAVGVSEGKGSLFRSAQASDGHSDLGSVPANVGATATV